MKLVPEHRPVTIHSVRFGERWFPQLLRHTDNSLLLWLAWGNDAAFAPSLHIRSTDNGRTWSEPESNVPRHAFSHSLAADELFELDAVGISDPNAPEDAVFWGAWSQPGRLGDEPQIDFVRMHLPSIKRTPLAALSSGYPTHPWWPIWNTLHGRDDMTSDEILLAGLAVGTGITLDDGRILALGYGHHKDSIGGHDSIFMITSADNGRTWTETGIAANGDAMAASPNEATLVRLRDGRLYAAMRVEGITRDPVKAVLHQMWSSDDGRTWTTPEPMRLIDSEHLPASVWPRAKVLEDGTLVMSYGRPGKHLIFDPTGTGTQWQGMLDLTAFEKETQTLLGVPEAQQLRRPGGPEDRHCDSSDYLALETDGPRTVIVVYDVQNYVENWNARPVSGVRMLRVRLED
ncbi:MAG TPA: hypothetical protein DIT01_15310 [Lentisphaeria bacterium]|nr:hypothetical protein [Lentisphaeria bacterium]|tara:strand:- start:1348 stop:2556 length:1209 start_codon:yes stop_codon:yes gene_type:complete